jgi:hypothetical protein
MFTLSTGYVTANAVLLRLDETNTSSIIQRANTTEDDEFTYEKFDQVRDYYHTNVPCLQTLF